MKISLNLFRTIEWYNKFLYRDRETMKPFFGKFDLAKEIFLSCNFQIPNPNPHQNEMNPSTRGSGQREKFYFTKIHVIVTLIFSLIL